MNEKATQVPAGFVLPLNVLTKTDLSRLVDEFEQIDNELTAIAVRAKAGAAQVSHPVLSERLAGFMSENKLTIGNSQERTELRERLRQLKDSAPVVHMTFATEADPTSLQYLVQWLRTAAHPQALISVGLQPSLVAGVYMRTPNHVHDLSLRTLLGNSRGLLAKDLEALRGNR